MLAQQRLGKSREQVAAHVRRPVHRAPPQPDAFDDARLGQHRQHAGADDRGLAAAAHAEDQHEGATLRGLLTQRLQNIGDGACPAEEHRCVFELEGLQAAERRALLPDRARLRGGGDAARQLTLDQPAQVVLHQDLEVARRREGVEGRDQGPLGLVVEPLVDEHVELLLLREPLHQVLLVVQPDRRRCCLAVDEQVGLAVPAKALHRFLELELGARLVARAVLAPELLQAAWCRGATRESRRRRRWPTASRSGAGRSRSRPAARAPRARARAPPGRCIRSAAVR